MVTINIPTIYRQPSHENKKYRIRVNADDRQARYKTNSKAGNH